MVAYYLPEPHSNAAQQVLLDTPDAAVSDLVEVEFLLALGRRVRIRELTREDARRIAALFVSHLEGGAYGRLAVEHTAFAMARAWLSTFETPLRSLDALHLAMAAIHKFPIVTVDAGLARAAAGLGVQARLIGR